MPTVIEQKLDAWVAAKVIEAEVADRIRAFEADTASQKGTRIAVQVAVALGSIALAAGVLLFVAAHWDDISPAARFALVLLMVAIFHLTGAALASRSHLYATAMHALGTVALGAGIFLAGQIFNMQEHWPGALMLWFIGAVGAFLLLRDPVQGLFAALLAPAWLISEWMVATERFANDPMQGLVPLSGLVLAGFVCLSGYALRRTLIWRVLGGIGGLFAIASACGLIVIAATDRTHGTQIPTEYVVLGFMVAGIAPLVWAWVVERSLLWPNLAAAVWTALAIVIARAVGQPDGRGNTYLAFLWLLAGTTAFVWWAAQRHDKELVQYGNMCALLGIVGILAVGNESVLPYVLAAAASAAWAGWGVSIGRLENINVGVFMFAITVTWFYFARLLDMIGRSAGLIGVGVLFLLGGWALARTRKQLIARVRTV